MEHHAEITRRAAVGVLAAAPLAMPGIIRAQSTSKPVRIGLLSDMGGPYRDVGGPGNRLAVELAIADFGGSVLGRPIEVLQGDDQNKPDVSQSRWRANGSTARASMSWPMARRSSAGLAIQQICEREEAHLPDHRPGHIRHDRQAVLAVRHSFGLRHLRAVPWHRDRAYQGRRRQWFFITADYAFGYALERDTIAAVQAAGGKVLGTVRAPLGTADFSSYLVQAKASGAKVMGFANAGTDLQNCIKQAAEFGLSQGGVRMATLLMAINDVHSLGQKTCEGLVYTDSFYWDMTDKTRAWAKRWSAKMNGMVPGLLHAGNYAAATHWLKAVKAAGTTDADTVVAQMKATPVNDMYNTDVKIREDGRVMHVMHLWQVKTVAESKYPYDYCKEVVSIPPDQAWRPLADGGCPLVKA